MKMRPEGFGRRGVEKTVPSEKGRGTPFTLKMILDHYKASAKEDKHNDLSNPRVSGMVAELGHMDHSKKGQFTEAEKRFIENLVAEINRLSHRV